MQILNAVPRDGFTVAQVTALLVAPDLSVDFGCELLDANLNLVADISADVSAGTVTRDNYAVVHGDVSLTISRQLAWGRDRVRPFMLLAAPSVLPAIVDETTWVEGDFFSDIFTDIFPGTERVVRTPRPLPTVRFNQGVYLLVTPNLPLAETPTTYAVTGYDQIHLLQDFIGDSYSVPAGAVVLTEVLSVFTAAGITTPVLLDTSAVNAQLVADLTFPLTSGAGPTWLEVINKLLAAVSYRGIWCNEDGAFCSGPLVDPAQRPSEWTFKVGDLETGVVATDRNVVADLWNAPNWWRFIANGLPVAPVEIVTYPSMSSNNGQYTVENLDTGPSSQASVGRIVHAPTVFLDAVDDTSLKAQGDALVAAAQRTTEVITLKLSPLPIGGHFDVVTYSDAALGVDRKAQCRSWSLDLLGSDGDYILETVG